MTNALTQLMVAERAARLRRLCANVVTDGDYPLLVEHRLGGSKTNALVNCVIMYLYDSLYHVYPDITYVMDHFLFYRHEGQIRDLPNITPNGLLLPRRHSLLSFNRLHNCLADIIRSFKLDGVLKIQSPINVRIVNGEADPVKDARPRSSTKLHSDVMAGEVTNHVMIHFPLFGDLERNGVEFYEPGDGFYPDLVRPLDDFQECAGLLDGARKYDLTMRVGSTYFLDSYLLHRTMKRVPGLRLTVHFAVLVEPVSTDLPIDTQRHDNYVDAADWLDYGSERLLLFGSQALDQAKDSTDSAVRNSFAVRNTTVAL